MTTQTLLDFDLGESSSDSDFRIEDHDDDSDDFSVNSNDQSDKDYSNDSEDDDDDGDDSVAEPQFPAFTESKNGKDNNLTAAAFLAQSKAKETFEKENAKLLAIPICSACLGDRSDDTNEIVECDSCGISVHEGCYGITDSASVSSTVSSCSTEPWFCEACKANIVEPSCELCPNKGGIFKETDVGKWVHLVCALYVPGVAFGEVDQLSSVTLFEMPYSKWGAKLCSLCDDARYARCGVCIGCDAGMCKTYFHVTCAQAAGLLSETHSEEADHADPFYAHCKIHSDKTLIKHRKRNYHALRVKMNYKSMSANQNNKLENSTTEQQRIERKLKKHRCKYVTNKRVKSEPWVPTQKMPRMLTTSASACRRLILKAELMEIDTAAIEFQDTQMAALADVRKKWHISPAFSVEFIGYYLDRISRVKEIKKNLRQQIELNSTLMEDQKRLRENYDDAIKLHSKQMSIKCSLNESIENVHASIRALCPTKSLATAESISKICETIVNPLPFQPPPSRPMSVPTAAALKMGVGFPLTNLPGTNDDTNRILSTQCQKQPELLHECGICKQINDQHFLAKCDTCHLHYHLGCLTPPLTRHPKKSKIYGWQCSECDEDNPDGVVQLATGPRKSRTKYSKDGTIVPVDSSLDNSREEKLNSTTPEIVKCTSPTATATKTKIKYVEKEIVKVEIEKLIMESNPIEIPINSNAETKSPSVELRKSPSKRKTNKKSSKINNTNSFSETDCDSIGQSPRKDNASVKAEKKLTIVPNDEEKLFLKQKPKSGQKKKKDKTKTVDNIINDMTNVEKINDNSNSIEVTAINLPNSNSIEEKKMEVDKPAEVTTELPTNEIPSVAEKIVAEDAIAVTHKQSRKRRKEKHRNKDRSDRSSSKEHKKKRKRKNHDEEKPDSFGLCDGVPKIKIKFKALPLPGEIAAESHFFYVPANMVRPRDFCRSRPASVDSIDEISTKSVRLDSQTPSSQMPKNQIISPATSTPTIPLIRTRRLSVLMSPSRMNNKRVSTPIALASGNSDESSGGQLLCDVCHTIGTNTDLVECDECKKKYHFRCLEPPLKKTPKRRGYSWHCADCDPTDKEDN